MRPDLRWTAIESNLKKWRSVDHVQVRPIVLLTDEHKDTLMIPERCKLVLSTARGPEGRNRPTNRVLLEPEHCCEPDDWVGEGTARTGNVSEYVVDGGAGLRPNAACVQVGKA